MVIKMKSDRRKTRSTFTKWEQRFSFSVSNAVITSTIVNLVRLLISTASFITFNPIRVAMNWGVNDDPIDERVQIACVWRPDTFGHNPSWDEVLAMNLVFRDTQDWRSIGTVGQVIQTMNRIDKKLDGPDSTFASRFDRPGVTGSTTLAIVGRSGTTSNVTMDGFVDVEITSEQMIERDDPADWAGYTFEESIMGMLN